MRELEEAKANRAAMKNKNGAKTKKGQTLKAKRKLILSCTDNLVPSTSSANNEATVCPDCEQIASSLNFVRSGGLRTVQVTKALENLLVITAKFSGCVLLDSRPACSYPPCRVRVRICHIFSIL